ncbi:type II secretion system F family protein [Bianquea renquensis]|uniref:Type II secretion system F family protein n=1 Tax=Bianquea renquensis TaxID=2763661 RepID=A0A926DQ51_9FIRM|nr:type II secretion system F family protein [Bianquea renquensis]MBC8542476.1 type II secretion system F family protein [Bianquea renquensis]
MVWVVLALEGILLILFVVSHWRYHKSKIQFSIRFDGKKAGIERILTPLGMLIVVNILHVKFAKDYKKAAFEDIRQMVPAGDTKQLYQIFIAQKVGMALGILFLCNACLVFSMSASSNSKGEAFNGVSIDRPEYQQGDAGERLLLSARFEDTVIQREVVVTVPEQQPDAIQRRQELEEAKAYLQDYFHELGTIREDIKLPDHRKSVNFFYSSGLPEYIRDDGRLRRENLPREETEVPMQVILRSGEEEAAITFSLVLAGKTEDLEAQVEEMVENLNAGVYSTATEVLLPANGAGAVRYEWQKVEKRPAFLLWVLLIWLIPFLLFIGRDRELKKAVEQRREAMRIAYPEVINRFVILLGAGLSTQRAWTKITDDYLEKRKGLEGTIQPIYEEMQIASLQMQNGTSPKEALEQFAARVKVKEIRQFVSVLSQNLKRGDEFIITHLRELNSQAWELRKKYVQEKSEEVDTKLLIPMMLMLVVILIVVLAPAIMTMQIG